MRPIPKGVRVCEYDGQRMSKAVADARYLGRPVTYLFSCGGNTVIDGSGMAMFLNHSCNPNCETEQHGDRVFISAIRNIAAGEEAHLRVQPLRLRRRAPEMLLRRSQLPRHHVLRPRTQAPRPSRTPKTLRYLLSFAPLLVAQHIRVVVDQQRLGRRGQLA